jgi:hypothetical protein
MQKVAMVRWDNNNKTVAEHRQALSTVENNRSLPSILRPLFSRCCLLSWPGDSSSRWATSSNNKDAIGACCQMRRTMETVAEAIVCADNNKVEVVNNGYC